MQDALQYVYSLCKAGIILILQRQKWKFREFLKLLRLSQLIIERAEMQTQVSLTLGLSCYHCVLPVTFYQSPLFVGIISYSYFSVTTLLNIKQVILRNHET